MIEHQLRCLTNTLEMICTTIALHFYRKQASSFTADTAIFTALLTIGFMMRNTSPIGWVPLILIKILKQGSFPAFLKSGVLIALPLIGLCVYLDSLFYMHVNQQSEFRWTVTSLNFLNINVIQGLSKYFGDHAFTEYLCKFLVADIFRAYYPLLIMGMVSHAREQLSKRVEPEIEYMCSFYIIFFSLIGHKETRFLLPILPLLFLVLGFQV
mmetsp:Transcript_17852/g.30295  ORF Transcript_17852/g.30295 Transcript_17852/m.30295 type:complete len:211 (+) Transcript_17852:486-1118(+)